MKKKFSFALLFLLIVSCVGGYIWYKNYKEQQFLDAANKFKWDAYVVSAVSKNIATDISGVGSCVLTQSTGFRHDKKGQIEPFECHDISTAVFLRIKHYKQKGFEKNVNKYIKHMDSCMVVMQECPEKYEKILPYFSKAKEDVVKLSMQVFNPTTSYMFFMQNINQLETDVVSNLKQTDLYIKDYQKDAEVRAKNFWSTEDLNDYLFIIYFASQPIQFGF